MIPGEERRIDRARVIVLGVIVEILLEPLGYFFPVVDYDVLGQRVGYVLFGETDYRSICNGYNRDRDRRYYCGLGLPS